MHISPMVSSLVTSINPMVKFMLRLIVACLMLLCCSCSRNIPGQEPWRDSEFYPRPVFNMTREQALEQLEWIESGCLKYVDSLELKDDRTERFRCSELASNTAYNEELREKIGRLTPDWSPEQRAEYVSKAPPAVNCLFCRRSDVGTLDRDAAYQLMDWVAHGCLKRVIEQIEAGTESQQEREACIRIAGDKAYRREIRSRIAELSPKWSVKQKQAVIDADLAVGSSPEMVLAILGKPEDVDVTLTAAGQEQLWIYPGNVYLLMVGNKLQGFKY